MAKPSIDELVKQITALQATVDKLLKAQEAPPPPAPKPTPPPAVSIQSTLPVPPEYRELVNTILNSKFQIDIKPADGSPAFDFALLVPREYSNAGKPHWDMYNEDRRTKVILSSLGLNGVRDYVTLVYNNFDNETKARITNDRATV